MSAAAARLPSDPRAIPSAGYGSAGFKRSATPVQAHACRDRTAVWWPQISAPERQMSFPDAARTDGTLEECLDELNELLAAAGPTRKQGVYARGSPRFRQGVRTRNAQVQREVSNRAGNAATVAVHASPAPRFGPRGGHMIRTARVSDHRRGRAQTRDESRAFVSTCPKCGRPEPQLAFSRSAIQRSLEKGRPIEAYCAMCDVYWQLSPQERAVMALELD